MKKTLSLFLVFAMLLTVVGTISITAGAVDPIITGTKTVYEANFQNGSCRVSGNTVTGSAFDITLAEGHHYSISSSDGLLWLGQATPANSKAIFKLPAVSSGILTVTVKFKTQQNIPGNIGSLRNGETPIVEIKESAVGGNNIAGVGVTQWVEATIKTIVNFTTRKYMVTVDGKTALDAELPEGAVIDNIFFDGEKGSDYRPLYSVKAEVSTGGANFLDIEGNLIAVQEITDGRVEAPEYDLPEGINLLGWYDDYGTFIEDVGAVAVSDGTTFRAVVDTEIVTAATEAELKDKISTAPTDGRKRIIRLSNNIDISGGITVNNGRNIVLQGDVTLKKTMANENALITANGSGTVLVLENIKIDMNAQALQKGGRAISVEKNAEVTLKGNGEIKNGWVKNGDCAIYVTEGNSKFFLEDNAKITGFKPKEDAEVTGIIGYCWGGQFIMNGGEISGNIIADAEKTNETCSGAVIYTASNTAGTGSNTRAYLNGGKIVNNTWTGKQNNFIFEAGRQQNSEPRGVWLSGEAELDGVLCVDVPVRIHNALTTPISIYSVLSPNGNADADGDGITDYYSTVLAEGQDGYIISENDLNKMSFGDGTDEYILFLNSIEGKIYAMDGDAEVRVGCIGQAVTRYTVTFINGDGSVMKEQKVREGRSAIPPTEIPEKASDREHSYVFDGWESYANITADRTVEPVWREIDPLPIYTVNFLNGDGSIMKTEQVEKGKDAAAPEDTPVKTEEGKFLRFEKWDTAFTNVQGNLEIHPIFAEVFRVRFYDRYGYVADEQMVIPGGSAKAPSNPSQSGCRFDGWSEDFTNVQSNLDIYPKFTQIFTVIFRGIGGVETKKETVDIHNDATPPTDSAMAVPNHTFMGWVDTNGNSVTDFTDITSNLTVDAVYEYTGAFETEVRDEVSLMDAIAYAPRTGAEYVINITKDIDIARTSSIDIAAGQNIVLKGDITLKKIGNHNRAFIYVPKNASITLEDVDIDLNGDKLNQTGKAIESEGSAALRGSAVIKNGIIGNNDSAVLAKDFRMSGTSKITGFKNTINADRCAIFTPNWGGTFIMEDYAEISNNAVVGGASKDNDRGGIISTTSMDALARQAHFEIRGNSKIVNNTLKGTEYAIFYINDSGGVNPKIDGTAQIEGMIFCDGAAVIYSALQYPLTLTAGLGADGIMDADEDGRADYYTTSVACGTIDYALTEEDLAKLHYGDDEYILCLKISDGHVNVMDADAEGRPGYIVQSIPKYEVNFYNGNGSIIATVQVREKGKAKAPETIPTKAADGEKVYRFSGWDKELTNIPAGGLEVYPLFNEFVVSGADKTDVEMEISGNKLTITAENFADGIKCVLITTDEAGNTATEILSGADMIFTKTGIDSTSTYRVFMINEEGTPVSEPYTYKNGEAKVDNPNAVVGGSAKVTDVDYAIDAINKTITVNGKYQADTTVFLKVSLNGTQKMYNGANCGEDGSFSFELSYAGDFATLTADDTYALEFYDVLSAVGIASGKTEIDPVINAEYTDIMAEIDEIADGAGLVEYEKTNAETLKLLGIDTSKGYELLTASNKKSVMSAILPMIKTENAAAAKTFNNTVKTMLEEQAIEETNSAISSTLGGILTKYKDVIGFSDELWATYTKNKRSWMINFQNAIRIHIL